MALAIDGTSQVGQATGASVVTSAALTTAVNGSIIIACSSAEWLTSVGAAGTATFSGAGLAWAGKFALTHQVVAPASFPAYHRMEIGWAFASGTLSAQAISATYTKPGGNNFDDACITVFGVKGFLGTAYQSNPWDGNVSNGATATSEAGAAPTVNITTAATSSMALGYFSSTGPNNQAAGGVGSGYTYINGLQNQGGTNNECDDVEFQVVAAGTRAVNWTVSRDGWTLMAAALAQGTAGGGSPLRLNSSLDGLGASGPFFSNPLARSVLGWRPSIVTARRKLIVPSRQIERLAA